MTRTGLDRIDVARLLDISPRTVSRWLHREIEPPPDAHEDLLELIVVLEQLSRVLKLAPAHDCLHSSPSPLLEHHRPVELLSEGEHRRVLGAIDALAEGVFV
jgi:transcriptional regulator with XRE-family HTH domain